MGVLSCIPIISSADEVQESESKIRKPRYLELGYSAASFDDVKRSGSYGISLTSMPWKLYRSLYIGFHISEYMNFGLVDSKSSFMETKLGPSLGYMVSPRITIALPVVISMQYVNEMSFGIAWFPTIYFDLYKKWGICVAPMFSKKFAKLSRGFYNKNHKNSLEVEYGFMAGMYWRF